MQTQFNYIIHIFQNSVLNTLLSTHPSITSSDKTIAQSKMKL